MTGGERTGGIVEGLAGFYGLFPKRLRSALMPLSVSAYGAARRLGKAASRIRMSAYWLEGVEKRGGRELSILAFVDDRALPFLVERAFTEVRVSRRLGPVSWGSAISAFPSYQARADLVVVHGDGALARPFSRRGFLMIPDWVGLRLDLADWEGGTRPFPANKTIRENMRRIRKHGYSFEVTTDPALFELFYREMYLPFIPPRFGETAQIVGRRLMKLFFDGGVLLLVRRDDAYVAGNIILRFPDRAKSIILGLRGGDPDLKRKAALSASYYFTIRWALDNGLRWLDFGECRPFLNDGLLLFKKRWGMSLEKARLQPDGYGLKVMRFSPAVRDFLAGNPFVFFDRGKPKGLVLAASDRALSSEDVRSLAGSLFLPGLGKLFVLSESGFEAGSDEGAETDAVEGIVRVRIRPERFFRDLPGSLDPDKAGP
ncbi:MAG: GNAT family N-acetyltransferase [Candidatus Aminicenantales bacterium]